MRRSHHTFTAVLNISKSLSIARIIPIASTGSHIERNTVVRMSIHAPGIPAAHTDASMIMMTIVICWANERSIPTTWEINSAAHAWYRAVPSIFMVVPIGKVKLTTSSESLALSFATRIETHIVALLEEVENATSMASFTLKKYFFGLNFQIKYQIIGRVIQACIAKPKSETPANGRSFMILSTQLWATTHDTIANTHTGVSFITHEIKVSIPLFTVSVSVLSCRISFSLSIRDKGYSEYDSHSYYLHSIKVNECLHNIIWNNRKQETWKAESF